MSSPVLQRHSCKLGCQVVENLAAVAQDYLVDMQWNQQYAFHNRRFMMELLVGCIGEVSHRTPNMDKLINR